MPDVIALIPARSGSQRVSNKNVRSLGDHPLLAYTIAAALDSGIFTRIVVSTDSEAYAGLAKHYGAEVPFLRPVELATSTSPDIEWVRFTLERIAKGGCSYDCFSILRPTSPFRRSETIRRAWAAFCAEEGVDSLRAVERVTQHPGKMWIVRGNRMLPLLALSPANQPWHSTQMAALPEVFVQNASLEIAWSHVVSNGLNIAGVSVMPFFTDEVEGFDINNEYDWEYAQIMVAKGRVTLPPVEQAPYGELMNRGARLG
jgi:CMP-N,N'-diacetyllegionaminic acid synthase